MITLTDVSYSYPGSLRPALTGLTASLGPGIHLLLGENGAGKTTLLHLLATLLFPSAGSIEIDGVATHRRLPSTLGSIFFLADDDTLPAADIATLARLHAPVFYPRFSPEMLADNLAAFGIDPRHPLASMSLGQRHKAQVAYALALRPEILLLDEPANGLDISSRDTLRSMMARCVEPDQTVVVSTHTTADLQPLFDAIIMLRGGDLLFALPTADIASRISFAISSIPPADALFSMTDIGRFRSIVPATADGSGADTEIDIHLLYNALRSPSAPEILKIITA